MKFRGGEFPTGTTGNFQPELTPLPTDGECLPLKPEPREHLYQPSMDCWPRLRFITISRLFHAMSEILRTRKFPR